MNRWLKASLGLAIAAAVAVGSSVADVREQARATSIDKAPSNKAQVIGSIQGKTLSVVIYSDGDYSIASRGIAGAVVRSDVEADVGDRVLRSSAYPQHRIVQSDFQDEFGSGSILTVTHTGVPGLPDLLCIVRLFRDRS